MTLIVQNDAGDEPGANGYISVAEFKAYHDARGNSYAGKTDPQIEAAIVRATDYEDSRFVFRGIKLNTAGQDTQFPRKGGADVSLYWYDINFALPAIVGTDATRTLVGPNGEDLSGIPVPLKNATAEYSMRALSAALFADAPPPAGGRLTVSESVSVGDISQAITFAGSQGTGNFVMPAYPQADLMLSRAGLIETGRTVYR